MELQLEKELLKSVNTVRAPLVGEKYYYQYLMFAIAGTFLPADDILPLFR